MTCPNCGYCPHCGRSGFRPVWPWVWWQYPWTSYPVYTSSPNISVTSRRSSGG